MSTESIIHFAGPVMSFGMIARQRCAWCGALIEEIDMASAGVEEESRPPERRGTPITDDDFGWWTGLVEISGMNPVRKTTVEDSPDGDAPERSCMMLLPPEVS